MAEALASDVAIFFYFRAFDGGGAARVDINIKILEILDHLG